MFSDYLRTVLEALKECGCRRVRVTPITPRGIYAGYWGEHCPHCNVQSGEEHLLGCSFATFPEDEPAREIVLKRQVNARDHAGRSVSTETERSNR